MAITRELINEDRKLRTALDLIKMHITAKPGQQSRDLHRAIGLIVDVARGHNLLNQEWSARLIADMAATSPMMYACDACAQDIEHDVVTDDEGRLELTGRTGSFYAFCDLCGGVATHEVAHRQVQ